MAITGLHALLYTSEPEAVRAIFRDVFGWRHVDAGDGWLIFAAPPAELGVHPADEGGRHDVSLICDDMRTTMAELLAKGIEFDGDPVEESFGITVTMRLPGGADVLLYEPRYPTAT